MNPEDAISSLSGSWNVGTVPEGNWFLPQDTQIRPRAGILERARDYIYGSEVGRRAMSAVDMWNSLTGGLHLGNIAPGSQQAITPALERLVGEGKIGRAANLLSGERGFFMDRMGDVYDLGPTYAPGGVEHADVLKRIGAMSMDRGFREALSDQGLMRIRDFKGQIGLEMGRMPSNAEMEQLMALFEKNPQKPVSLELYHPTGPLKFVNKTFDNPSDAIQAIYSFFGK